MPKKRRSNMQEPTSAPSAPSSISKYWDWALVAAVILFVAAIRIRLLQTPLERDEGEFGYMGQLMLQGIPPYKLAYNMKFPGIYAAYALVLGIFGQTIAAVHIGLMIVNSISIVLIFLIGKRLFDRLTGVVAAATFAILSVHPAVLGTSAHATQYAAPFALGGILLLLKAIESGKTMPVFWSGMLLGISLLMKQHAALFIPFACLYYIWSLMGKRPIAWSRLGSGVGMLLVGSVIPFGAACLWLYTAGVFANFWFWTFTYAHQYVSQLPVSKGIIMLRVVGGDIARSYIWLLGIAAAGIAAISWDKKARANSAFLLGFLAFSFLTTCPGMFFRSHYFVLMLPAIGLLAGVAVSATVNLLLEWKSPRAVQAIPIAVFLLAALVTVYAQRVIFFQATPVTACRMRYGLNPFPESVGVAKYIKDHSSKDDVVAVLGSEPEIYFYSQRHSATGFIYVYGLMEPQIYASKMQQDMIREIESSKPKFIVFTNVRTSWLARPESDMSIVRWAARYATDHYRLVGVVDMASAADCRAYWGKDAAKYTPTASDNVFVFERKARQ